METLHFSVRGLMLDPAVEAVEVVVVLSKRRGMLASHFFYVSLCDYSIHAMIRKNPDVCVFICVYRVMRVRSI